MTGTSPLVSVIIPAYNAERFILRAVRSAQAQTDRYVQIVVVDDGSTDATGELVRSVHDDRVVYVRQDNTGAGEARNHGLCVSSGEYVCFLDADDWYLPDKVEKQVAFLECHPECSVVYCEAAHYRTNRPHRFFRPRSRYATQDTLAALLQGSLINPSTFMMRREVAEEGFVFGEGDHGIYAEEWGLYLRLARASHRFGYVPEELVVVEVRKDSHTTWDIQWIMKKTAVEMLEGVGATLTPEERARYNLDAYVARERGKLALACLIGGRPAEAVDAGRAAGLGPLSLAAIRALGALPQGVVRPVLIGIWLLNRRRHYVRVKGRLFAPPQ